MWINRVVSDSLISIFSSSQVNFCKSFSVNLRGLIIVTFATAHEL